MKHLHFHRLGCNNYTPDVAWRKIATLKRAPISFPHSGIKAFAARRTRCGLSSSSKSKAHYPSVRALLVGRGGRVGCRTQAPLRDCCRCQRSPDHVYPEESPGYEQESPHHGGVCTHCILQRRERPFGIENGFRHRWNPEPVNHGQCGRPALRLRRPWSVKSPRLRLRMNSCNRSASCTRSRWAGNGGFVRGVFSLFGHPTTRGSRVTAFCRRNSIARTPGVRYRWTGRGRGNTAGEGSWRAGES